MNTINKMQNNYERENSQQLIEELNKKYLYIISELKEEQHIKEKEPQEKITNLEDDNKEY